MRKAIALVLGALLLSGRTVRVTDLTAASIKNYNLNGSKFYEGECATIEDSYPIIIFPLGIPNVGAVADQAVEKDRYAVGLSDVVVTRLNHSFLFGKTGLCVESNLVIDRSLSGCKNAS